MSCLKLPEAEKRFQREPADTLILNFWPLELEDNAFLLWKPSVWGTLSTGTLTYLRLTSLPMTDERWAQACQLFWLQVGQNSPVMCDPVPPSIRVFSNESNLRMRWPKYWSKL